MDRKCAQCGGPLTRNVLGELGHGGSVWWSCDRGCKNIWGVPRGID